MSAITDILDRLSGLAILKERLSETNRNVERSMAWLLDHEKRLIRLEATGQLMPAPPKPKRLPGK